MARFDQHRSAEQLEQRMGDPFDPASPFSFQRSVEHDERDEFPEEGLARLYEWDFHHYFIPARYGGQLHSLEEMFMLGRVLSRRDSALFLEQLTSFLGSMPVYIGGSEAQKRHAAEMVRGRRLIAFGLTERPHGADILATEVHAARTPSGWRLSGEKWAINGANRFGGAVVLARHDGDDDPSFLFFDKAASDPQSWEILPRFKTLGFCGIDLSGIRFHGTELPEDAIIGGRGRGLELSVKGVQLSRSEIPALSMGWADTAMRVVLDFAAERRMYGDRVLAIPHARNVIAGAFGQILACEAVAMATVRCLQIAPDQAFLWQAVSKYFVPTILARTIQDLSVVLGIRFYLRQEHWAGIFQKLLRDSLIGPMFDGSTVVNLSLLNAQLPAVCRTPSWSSDAAGEQVLRQIFSLAEPVPVFAPERLVLRYAGREDLTRSLPAALSRLEAAGAAGVDPAAHRALLAMAREVADAVGALERQVAELASERIDKSARSVGMFRCAERFCALFTAASAIQLWLENRDRLDDYHAKGYGLATALHAMLALVEPSRAPLPTELVDRAITELEAQLQADRLFSAMPVQLASHRNRTTRAR